MLGVSCWVLRRDCSASWHGSFGCCLFCCFSGAWASRLPLQTASLAVWTAALAWGPWTGRSWDPPCSCMLHKGGSSCQSWLLGQAQHCVPA